MKDFNGDDTDNISIFNSVSVIISPHEKGIYMWRSRSKST